MELWKPLNRFPGYEVSNTGKVKSLKGREEKLLKQVPTKDGYLFVCLSVNNKKFTSYIHRLVAEAFLPIDQILIDRSQVNHKDKNVQNNILENLEWVSYSKNMFHRYDPELYNLFSQIEKVCHSMDKKSLKKFVEIGMSMMR